MCFTRGIAYQGTRKAKLNIYNGTHSMNTLYSKNNLISIIISSDNNKKNLDVLVHVDELIVINKR